MEINIKNDTFKDVLDRFIGGLPEYEDELLLFRGVKINGVDLYSFITAPTEHQYNALIEYLDLCIAKMVKADERYAAIRIYGPCIRFRLAKSRLEGIKQSLKVAWDYWKLCVEERRRSKSA